MTAKILKFKSARNEDYQSVEDRVRDWDRKYFENYFETVATEMEKRAQEHKEWEAFREVGRASMPYPNAS